MSKRLFIALGIGILSLIVVCPWIINSSLVYSATPEEIETECREIAKELVCLCGCGNMVLETCTCGEASKNKEFIRKQLKAGKTRLQIFQLFRDKDGERVFAAPVKEGFNWIIWVIVPYVVPVLAALGLGVLLLKWTKQRKEPELTATPISGKEGDEPPDQYKEKLERELKELE